MKNKVIVWSFFALVVGLGLWNSLQTDQTYSMSERRKLKQFPEVSWENITSGRFMSNFEEYTQDQFVGREDFRTLKAASEIYVFGKKDNNGIYVADGYACALEYPLKEESLNNAAKKFRQVYDTYLTGQENQVYFSIIPDKNYYLAKENGYLTMDYEDLFAIMKKQTHFMRYIDISELLEIEDYYRTDTHWKQENLPDVAQYLAEGMGTAPLAISELDNVSGDTDEFDKVYEKVTISDEFYGVYAGQLALPLQADSLTYLDSELLWQCEVYDYQNDIKRPVYNLELAAGKDPYELFLSGSLSLVTIENPFGISGKELILFRDSFGSSLAPLLMEYYDKITLVDIRYLPISQLGRYIEFEGKDVLFLYSTLVLNNSETFK